MPDASVARSLASVSVFPFTSTRARSSGRNFQLAAAAGDARSAAQTRTVRAGQGWGRRRSAIMEIPHTNTGNMIAGAAAPGIFGRGAHQRPLAGLARPRSGPPILPRLTFGEDDGCR